MMSITRKSASWSLLVLVTGCALVATGCSKKTAPPDVTQTTPAPDSSSSTNNGNTDGSSDGNADGSESDQSLKDIFFTYDGHTLSEEARSALSGNASYLREMGALRSRSRGIATSGGRSSTTWPSASDVPSQPATTCWTSVSSPPAWPPSPMVRSAPSKWDTMSRPGRRIVGPTSGSPIPDEAVEPPEAGGGNRGRPPPRHPPCRLFAEPVFPAARECRGIGRDPPRDEVGAGRHGRKDRGP
ncbi:MAG: hypothetical protein FD129_2113 [bacterium]|nr:MAG: hypothetical protein FD129_2113 [bacterium]